MSRDFAPAAGVVVLKHMDGDYHVLCLVTPSGKYDLTKGIIDPGETSFEAAIRETREEAAITELEFPFGKVSHVYDACEMFVGLTEQEPEITANPHSGIWEHKDYVWLPILEAVNSDKIKKFLQPAIMFAFDLVRPKP